MKHPVRYRLEFYLARLFWALFAALPVAVASNLGGALGGIVGRLPPLARRAERNLRLAMPELSQSERAAIIAGVWRNLGRTLAELPHVGGFSLTEDEPRSGQIQMCGGEYLTAHLGQAKSTLLFSAHMANWELMAPAIKARAQAVHVVYRAPNNPLIDSWLQQVREGVSLSALAKGRSAARSILSALKDGESVAMLVDQKMNDGIAVPFFGRPAMTAPALAQLALRQDLVVLPVRCERLTGAAFRVTVLAPLPIVKSGDHMADVAAMMGQVNDLLESWIRERPEQWLWLHNRWPK